MRTGCEACQVFNCACIYGNEALVGAMSQSLTWSKDAIPKKRGPKTDVLEALLKRVNGLERKLKDDKKPGSPEVAVDREEGGNVQFETEDEQTEGPAESRIAEETPRIELAHPPPQQQPLVQQTVQYEGAREAIAFTDALLDTFFSRLHDKPYYILDETATRNRLRDGHLPQYLVNAVHAVSIRYVPHLCGGPAGAARSSQDHALRARADIDVDEPSIDHLQALLLLAIASFQSGRGKKSYMILSHALSMAFALDLHRELPAMRIPAAERESRRKLFWTCYLMDRFTVSGSKRPALISDEAIYLRLPSYHPQGSSNAIEGNFFANGASLPYASGISSANPSSGAMLVEIVRILGRANRYLASGGVKGDSHFPWHSNSTLTQIRSDLDLFAALTAEVFTSYEAMFTQPDSTPLVLSRLIYHLVHCLIYRPFLPLDLAELTGPGQHQSWQIEATHVCFMHANEIAQTVEVGKSFGFTLWPAFVGYCLCTAGSIHVHGAHYISFQEGDLYRSSADYLRKEIAHLAELRCLWACVQHQHDTLQAVFASHSQLVASLASSPMRFSPVFQMDDFFDRYPGTYFDGAHIPFADVPVDGSAENGQTYNAYSWQNPMQLPYNNGLTPTIPSQSNISGPEMDHRKTKRRRTTNESSFSLPVPPVELNVQLAHQQRTYQPEMPSAPGGHHRANSQHQMSSATPPSATSATDYNNVGSQFLFPDHVQNQTLTQSALSPTFGFSPLPFAPTSYPTPGGLSVSNESNHTDPDKDPFLSLLEQLAQNDIGNGQGPSDLGFYLSGQG